MNEISDKNVAITSLNLRDFFRIPRFVKDFYAIPQYIPPKTSVSPGFLDKIAKNPTKTDKNTQELANLSFPLRKVPVIPQKNHVFLDEIAKNRRNSPSPNEYQRNSPWFSPKSREIPRKLAKISKKPEEIRESRAIPGVGDYNLLETEANVAKKLEKLKKLCEIRKKNSAKLEKTQFLCDNQFLAAETPGPGAYNPRFPGKSAKSASPPRGIPGKTQAIAHKVAKSPDNLLKYTPLPVDCFTFARYEQEIARKRKGKGKKLALLLGNFMGNDKRFKYIEEKRGFDPGPAPDHYKLKDFWAKAGKNDAKNKKTRDFFL